MQQIADWLESLGMSGYAQRFAENGIDVAALPHLTDQDLKEIGVLLGHRRIMLAAISKLAGAAPAALEPRAEPKPQDTAERRQVTVMFSDLVGSTALSARMDPEDLREVISAYQKCVAEIVQRFGGFVAKYMGDGVLIYFGYPQAHEDDAERAVRAGLELVAAVGALNTHAPLQTRVGIATGLVVVGDLIGSGASQEQAIVGETPNLAARLQGIAERNSVVIAESARKLVGNLFELEDLGAQDLKGIAGPVRAWAVLRASSAEGRFEAMHASRLTELVGREEELEMLLRRWSKAKTGEGQVVLLSGEAGIGKSRLTAALLERLADEPHTRLRYFCSPQHTDSAFYPIIGQMERAAALSRNDSLQAKLDKLDAMLAQSSTSAQDAALLAEMLSLPNDGRYPAALKLTPQQRRQRTLEALVSQIVALSHQNPLLMIFEDAHWTDPTTLELFGRIVDRIPTLRVLLVVTFRPEFNPPWIGWPYVTALTINRLADREVGALIDHVVGNELLSPSVRQNIIAHTDGIPLFVEEMTKAVLELAAERIAAAVPSQALTVPPSLNASLMARLDRLGPAKEVAQIGAAIGREFSHALVASVVGKPEVEVNLALDRLVAAGLLFRQGVAPHATYLFKHALVRDAAYGTLTREPRRALHVHIAETLANQLDAAETQPEVLARHFGEAGLVENAVYWWAKAGRRSLERSALAEAVEQLTRANSLIEILTPTDELRRKQFELQVALISPLGHLKGFASPEARANIEKARALVEQAEEPGDTARQLFLVLTGLWIASYNAFDGDAVRGLAAQLLSLAEKQGATYPLIVGHQFMGMSLAATGDIAEGRAHYDQGVMLYDPAVHRALATRFGQDARVSILSHRSMALWLLGYPDAALADAKQALQEARDIGQATTLMFALFWTSLSQSFCGNFATATKEHDELIVSADEKGSLFWKAYCTSMQGCLFALTGKASDAVQTISAGIAACRSTGASFFAPLSLSYVAKAYAELGQFDDAWRCIGEAKSAVETTGERWCEAEVYHVKGEIALMSPKQDVPQAETHFQRALAVSRQQQAKSWELRAAMSLARLWRDQGKPQQARELLAPVYEWFTEGFDTRDLKEAKALLHELA